MLKRKSTTTRSFGKPSKALAKSQPPAVTAPVSQPPQLPALDEPAVNGNEPAVSYKTHFKDFSSWYASRDGGKTSVSMESNVVAGKPIDILILATPAVGRDGMDFRLRLGFIDSNGELAELNLNACNTNKQGQTYVTSPARSLIGALLEASESEDDMEAFTNGARFTVTPGTGKGLFITVDAAWQGRWIRLGGASSTSRVANDPAKFFDQMGLIKKRFHASGFLPSDRVFQGAAPELPPAESAD